MIGALGGVTVFACLMQKGGVKPAVLLMWLLFAAVGLLHQGGIAL